MNFAFSLASTSTRADLAKHGKVADQSEHDAHCSTVAVEFVVTEIKVDAKPVRKWCLQHSVKFHHPILNALGKIATSLDHLQGVVDVSNASRTLQLGDNPPFTHLHRDFSGHALVYGIFTSGSACLRRSRQDILQPSGMTSIPTNDKRQKISFQSMTTENQKR